MSTTCADQPLGCMQIVGRDRVMEMSHCGLDFGKKNVKLVGSYMFYRGILLIIYFSGGL